MATNRQPNFEQEASLDELAGIGKNRGFDELIDGENEEIQVICKRGEEEIPLAKPSRAFYFGDRNLYDQEAKRFDAETKADILCRAAEERDLFDEVVCACAHNRLPPEVVAELPAIIPLRPFRAREMFCSRWRFLRGEAEKKL